MSDAFPPGFFDRIREEMGVAEGRSTGVQQGRVWFVFLCDHEEYHGDYAHPWPSEVGHTADEYTECSCGRPLRAVRVVEAVSPEPREGEQEGLVLGDPPHTAAVGLRKGVGAPLSSPSIASELRRTASRLRDPEYRWSVDPAVTLERLAEKLEKDDSLAEARGLASLDEAELSLLRAVIYGEGDGFTDDEVTRWRRVMQKIGFDPDGPNGF